MHGRDSASHFRSHASPRSDFSFLIKDCLILGVRIKLWAFSAAALIYKLILYQYLPSRKDLLTLSLRYFLESDVVMPVALFLSKIAFVFLGSLVFPYFPYQQINIIFHCQVACWATYSFPWSGTDLLFYLIRLLKQSIFFIHLTKWKFGILKFQLYKMWKYDSNLFFWKA